MPFIITFLAYAFKEGNPDFQNLKERRSRILSFHTGFNQEHVPFDIGINDFIN
jgi:hypothetical protein